MADGTQVDVVDAQGFPPAALTLVERAIERNADLTTIEKLMDLQDRQDRKVAEQEFNASMARAFADLPASIANDTKGHGYTYESLAALCHGVRPALAANGLSYRWETTYPEKLIEVTCVVSHANGHVTRSSRRAPLQDILPEKRKANAMQNQQAVASYLQRYTLRDALGLASGGDTDGSVAEDTGYDTLPWIQRIQCARDVVTLGEIQSDFKKEEDSIPPDARKLIVSTWQSRTKALTATEGGEDDAAA